METYLVGGAVRDQLLNYPYQERDWVVVGSTEQAMLDQGYRPVGKDFPVFLHPTTKEEYALARTERKSGKGYKGFTCFSNPDVSLEEDLLRRDLTINAMAMDKKRNIIDPYGGQQDLANKVLRHVSAAFCEDPVRILRVARFAARYHHLGFTIATETSELMRSMVSNGEVDHLVSERLWQETQRALREASPSIFFTTLYQCGALATISPPTHSLIQNTPSALDQLADSTKISGLGEVRLACLLNQANELKSIFSDFKAPKTYQKLASLVNTHLETARNINKADSEDILQLLRESGALQKQALFGHFLLCLSALMGESSAAMQQYLQNCTQQIIGINTQALQEQGLQGKRLGAAVKKQQLQIIRNDKQQLNHGK